MTGLSQSITDAAPEIIRTMAWHEGQTMLFILFLLVVDSLLHSPSPRFRYFLWLVALAKSLWPPFLSLSALDIWGRQAVTETLAPIFLAPVTSIAATEPTGFTLSWGVLALATWAALSLIILTIMALNFLRFRLRLRPPHAEPYSYDELPSATGRPWPPIWATGRIHSPLTMGLLRPRIYLTWKVISSGPKALRAILYHELAHILRRDGWITLLQAAALVIHPFNPLVWLMNARLSRYREQLCDDFALRYTGVAPRDYGNLLLDQLSQMKLPLLAVQTPTYFFETKRDLVHRLQQLMRRKEGMMKIITPPQKVLLAGLTMILLFITSQCQVKPRPTPTVEPPTPAIAAETDSVPSVKFIPYDEPPQPIGGYAVIQQHIVYPEEEKEAGIEGEVIVQAFITVDGKAGAVKVLRNETGAPSLGEAAMAAIRPVTWEPAKQEDKPVSVWISIPINFKLSEDEK